MRGLVGVRSTEPIGSRLDEDASDYAGLLGVGEMLLPGGKVVEYAEYLRICGP